MTSFLVGVTSPGGRSAADISGLPEFSVRGEAVEYAVRRMVFLAARFGFPVDVDGVRVALDAGCTAYVGVEDSTMVWSVDVFEVES